MCPSESCRNSRDYSTEWCRGVQDISLKGFVPRKSHSDLYKLKSNALLKYRMNFYIMHATSLVLKTETENTN